MAVRPPPTLDISVVLPVRNEAAHIERVLSEVLTQDLGPLTLEVLVVDGASGDDTAEVARRVAAQDARVRVLHNERRLSSAARALGAAEARGRYVAYVDGHCHVPSPTLLRDMVDLFERTGADCLARPQPLRAGENGYWPEVIAAARTSPFGHSADSTIYDHDEHAVSPVSAGAMYRREVFDRIGNFDPTFDACEDVEFNWRAADAGLSCWTGPQLALAYEPRRSLGALFKQMGRYGLGRARLHRKHPSSRTLESLVPAAFTLGLPILAVVPFVPPLPRLLLLAPFVLYALLDLVFSIQAASPARWRLVPGLLLAFPTIHVGLGWGYLRGLLSRRRATPVDEARPAREQAGAV